MPVRNEAEHLAQSLGSVLAQDWPTEALEVLVVDGRSSDGTAARAAAIADAAGREVVVLENPAGIVPTAMNLGLARARGEVVVRVDGHCSIPPSYVERCVQLLQDTGADCVGGVLHTVGETDGARAIAAAQSHPLGVGPVAFRTGATHGGPVDTLAFGAYRRDVFDRIGGFDEELVRNQDDELNLRLTEAGGVIWLDPTLVATYTSRATISGLWRQYHGYGSWKVRVQQKHGGVASWRHLVPAAFVVALAGGTVLAATGRRRPLVALAGAYGAVLAVATTTAEVSATARLRLPAVLATLHLAYGTGTLAGAWRWRAGWRHPPPLVGPTDGAMAGTDVAAEEQARVAESYRRYQQEGRPAGRWSRSNPGNRAMLAERDEVLLAALDAHPRGRTGVRVLDLGCGAGDVLGSLLDAGVPSEHLVGLDVRPEALEAARTCWPTISFVRSGPDRIAAESGTVDVLLAFTLFSSVHDERIARRLGAEVERVLAPGGVVAWYDLRVPSPGNRSLRPRRPAEVQALFPHLDGSLRPVTLLPPLARRLGGATGLLYPRLAVGPLRTHLVGTFRRT
jgi:SAM-dependent methyltransferase/GT2 family glycosyltransferase